MSEVQQHGGGSVSSKAGRKCCVVCGVLRFQTWGEGSRRSSRPTDRGCRCGLYVSLGQFRLSVGQGDLGRATRIVDAACMQIKNNPVGGVSVWSRMTCSVMRSCWAPFKIIRPFLNGSHKKFREMGPQQILIAISGARAHTFRSIFLVVAFAIMARARCARANTRGQFCRSCLALEWHAESHQKYNQKQVGNRNVSNLKPI